MYYERKASKTIINSLLALVLAGMLLILPACSAAPPSTPADSGTPSSTAPASPSTTPAAATSYHQPDTEVLIKMLDENPDLKAMFEKSIAMVAQANPDRVTNPAQNLEEYYSFIDWCALCMPWNIVYNYNYPTLLDSIDQSLNYFYFFLDQPLEELEGQGLYYPSLEYEPRVTEWMNVYTQHWGEYLSTPESWNIQYYYRALANEEFGLQNGWYEDKDNWHSFNDFFARKLADPSQRPIASPTDDSVVVAPADSESMGIWAIDENSNILASSQQQTAPDTFVSIKSKNYNSVQELLHGSAYASDFAGGTLTHTFLNVQDYHRYHFPVSGEVVEAKIIPAADNVGGLIGWSAEEKKYKLYSDQPNWESIETRGYVIVQTEQYGLVACMPVGMSQVSSVNILDTIKPGTKVQKGDELGYFLFGGSDYVIIFQKDVELKLTMPTDASGYAEHVLMGEEYGRLTLK